jgi:hypothetical protein
MLNAGISPHITTAFEKKAEHQNKYKSINAWVVSAILSFIFTGISPSFSAGLLAERGEVDQVGAEVKRLPE